MKQLKLTLLFLIINFTGLAIGSSFMENGGQNQWYSSLEKAPWTPPGWVFGVAWTSIMISFSIYLGKQFSKNTHLKLISTIFLIAFILNVSWNYIFFKQQLILYALLIITFLTIVLFYYYFMLSGRLKKYKYLLLPYMIWLCIATSLNLYILIYN